MLTQRNWLLADSQVAKPVAGVQRNFPSAVIELGQIYLNPNPPFAVSVSDVAPSEVAVSQLVRFGLGWLW
jgi:hypothetical protein